MRTGRRARAPLAALAAGAVLGGLLPAYAWAEGGPTAAEAPPRTLTPEPAPKAEPNRPDSVPADRRAAVLGSDYRRSGDLAWTTSGDAQGFHLLTAREKDGYTWQTTATLSEPGFDTDAWIGNACVTGSGKRAVVVYAPRTFTNEPQLMARGGFTAVVDLSTGAVTKLNLQASLSHYNPGCGVDEKAVLTQSGGEDKAATRLVALDAATGRLSKAIETPGQVTSSVPVKDGSIVGATGARLVRIDSRGGQTSLVRTDGTPYRLTPDADGGVVFLDKALDKRSGKTPATGAKTRAKRISAAGISAPDARRAKAALLAEGPLTDTGLTRSAAGTVFLTGTAEPLAGVRLPRTVKSLGRTPRTTRVSTLGEAALTETGWADGQGQLIRYDDPTAVRPVSVKLTALDSRRTAGFTVAPGKRAGVHIAEGAERSPALAAPAGSGKGSAAARSSKAGPRSAGGQTGSRAAGGESGALATTSAVGSRNEIVESERVCSVPRNDPRNQAMQPKPRQVEWAVDQAIRGVLNNHISRPANWKNLGMPAYQPQTLFPAPVLEGGGTIPAQVMLGVTAQESNMWQASRVAVPGVTGNPLIGNYYGIDLYDGNSQNDWNIDWAEADCGYGITQVTDHMRLAGREDGKGGTAWDYQKQRAVALDYTANVAAGLQILADKWNTTRRAGLKVNNGNPAKLENWAFALWSYNSGFYENPGTGQPWGVGWANNPANPEWDAGRSPFMEDPLGNEDAADAAHPQDWPYQEKVLGFAAHPPAFLESPGTMVPAFRAAWWNGTAGDATVAGSAMQNRAKVKPPEGLFCTAANSCDPAKISDGASNSAFTGPCTRTDFKCWWNQPVQWKSDCDFSCGNDFTRFPVTWAEEADGTAYPPLCTTSGLPAAARVIDDLPGGTPVVRSGCDNSGWTNKGTFSLDFGDGETDCSLCYVKWPAKIDLHQLGAGFGGHFYFGHTRKDDIKGQRLKMTGTWTLNETVNGPARVWVHLPDHGAQTKYATYTVHTAKGAKTRVVDQKGSANRWVSIGGYMFNGQPKVSLSTITPDGTGDQDIAFDAVAVEPINGRFVERSLTAAAIFDPNQNLDSSIPAEIDTPLRTMNTLYDWAIGLSYRGPRWDNPEADKYGITWRARCPSATPVGECSGQQTYDAAQRWYEDVKAGGHTPTTDGSAPAMSIPVWMAMSNQRPDPALSADVALQGDNSYKIKSEVDVTFIVDAATGKIVPGSESTGYRVRVGNAHLPHFVTNLMKAIEADYGIPKPYIDYTTYDALEYGRTLTSQPYADGDTPGQAFFPHLRGGRLNADNTCVDFRAVGGGVHGYRPMISNRYINDNVKAWVDKVNAHPEMNQGIKDFAGDVYSMFFKNSGGVNTFGSQIGNAPPIWQDIAAAFCADGSVKPTHLADNRDAIPANGIVYQSYMPDLYLYIDGRMTDNLGRPSNGPIKRGDWKNFSNMPVISGNGNAYGKCDVIERGSGGNPWTVDAPVPFIGDGPDKRPAGVVHCDEPAKGFTDNLTP
ncbi:hypothetical protein [Streptomyces sp. NPDC017868]|uniref:golvesin C-terminal-like domain-containing protein n=1 Tax=Streptomyces sp. NPDC017868 TaxID=3365014 RepID=UPI00378906C1